MSALPRLYVTYEGPRSWMYALEFGRVPDAQAADCWRELGSFFAYLHDSPGGRVVGFRVESLALFAPDHPDFAEVWGEPRFDVPVLGLSNSSAGEIVLAASAHFGERSSLNRELFLSAREVHGEEAVERWRRCLESGDPMAHFALGYELLELDRVQEAYRHLRHYTEIAPEGSWNWCWYGYAAQAMGEIAEAKRAYRRAIELTEAGDDETRAAERLAGIEEPEPVGASGSAPPSTAEGPGPAADVAEPTSVSPERVVLWGDELPELGRTAIAELAPGAAAGLTAGAAAKSYAHTDPNEDIVAVTSHGGTTLLVCADGHNGMAGARAAVEAVLERLDPPPDPGGLTDEALIDLWELAGARARAAGERAGQPDSRTTLEVALIGGGALRWATMGDSMLAVVRGGRAARFLGKSRHHFVGWPMSREQIDARLRRGSERVAAGTWVIAASDGLTEFVAKLREAIAAAVRDATDARSVVHRLINQACEGGAGDNVCVAAVRVAATKQQSGAAAVVRPAVVDRIRGCLFGGAVGNALGAPVEFDSIERIRARYGADGVTGFEVAHGRRGAATDDTQLTLFTAEGLIRTYVGEHVRAIPADVSAIVDHAYSRWLVTQGERSKRWPYRLTGWLVEEPAMHARRPAGKTTVAALRAATAGTIERPINRSKGSGAVMRTAPIGLVRPGAGGGVLTDAFGIGCRIGALTHGHPGGYLPAGALAVIIEALAWRDATLDQALDAALAALGGAPRARETRQALVAARRLAASGAEPSAKTIPRLGEGYVGEEALAIAAYCALGARDFAHGALCATNHSGDSDTTAAITGQILGARYGLRAIPDRWIQHVELGDVISRICADWIAIWATKPSASVELRIWQDRYPGS